MIKKNVSALLSWSHLHFLLCCSWWVLFFILVLYIIYCFTNIDFIVSNSFVSYFKFLGRTMVIRLCLCCCHSYLVKWVILFCSSIYSASKCAIDHWIENQCSIGAKWRPIECVRNYFCKQAWRDVSRSISSRMEGDWPVCQPKVLYGRGPSLAWALSSTIVVRSLS